ncbi:MAG: leucine--tRNA ligase [Cytophagales bacterium]|nr:leucine--tRNA ligase [Cytophagales bacterium]
MSEYRPSEIEKKWQKYWFENKTFKTVNPVANEKSKPKYYVLDMFPYPSGAGLHVGHPLGYIASDIVARYKRSKGYNVLHPMGYDAFGLPAEQYAVQTGQHPAVTTEQNIRRYRTQLDNIGFSYDWDREIRTCSPQYYKWTQWIFTKLFNCWYDSAQGKAQPIEMLYNIFASRGNMNLNIPCNEHTSSFTAEQWNNYSETQKYKISLNYRLAYLSDTYVNWCSALGTVLANEEVKDGLSERGGHPVIRKLMPQWQLRITAYADRLLQGLHEIDWPEAIKEQQRNWIGRSQGCMLTFNIKNSNLSIQVFTTRADTIFGVTYLTLAPEHELITQITTPEQADKVQKYVQYAKNRSERERMADVKTISGEYTGAYAINPFNGEPIPVWIGEYVLAGYGTGAVMAVPSSDVRDYAFAKYFNIPIIKVQEGENTDISKENFDPKAGTMINSEFLNGMNVKQALDAAIKKAEELGVGYAKINYKMRDSIFSRQRYWGEPFPVYYKEGMPYLIDEKNLPVLLPEIDDYKPTEDGEPPLARAAHWKYNGIYPFETSTMPGWAGSSWYFLRYMEPDNDKEPVNKQIAQYWQDVDLYIGGSEHATGHLLYSRFWQHFLYDLGIVPTKEYARKLVNQGMIQGRSNYVYRVAGQNTFVSFNLRNQYDTTPIYVDVSMVENDVLDIEKFKEWRAEYADAQFICENDKYICGYEVEKMSKSKYNVVNPDDIVAQYGADTLRLYEMFLGPLEMSKPWSTASISGVYRFLKNVWKLFYDENGNFLPNDEIPGEASQRILHKTIKKIEEDIDRLSLNTSVSTFMVCVNELTDMQCRSKALLQDFLIILSPYAPHICEELWQACGNNKSIAYAPFPEWDNSKIKENSFEYPISVNGKLRHKMTFALDTLPHDIEKEILAANEIIKWTDGKPPKKVIVVPGKIVNVVV